MAESLATWLSVDVFAVSPGDAPGLILARRQREPHQGDWALPGVVLDAAKGETVVAAAHRALRDRAGAEPIDGAPTVALVVSDPHRDERGHTVSLVNVLRAEPCDDALVVRNGEAVPDLPFGHNAMIRDTAATVSQRLLSDPATAAAMFGAGCTASEVCALTTLLFHLSGGTGAEPIPLAAMRRRLERAALFTADGSRPAHTRPVTVFRVAG
ncbi:NUDIX domain-containing protein [Mycolicibacterium sp. CBMA 226]|uniref:NUDIX domain-containing protein n=1 Tax=Mycolicibacterium sp. CBMA 226 TaxID=2606611 RepID=UPI0012DDB851|nr:NUDIX domain-containing protein [Mycolicibacterium sp. CBMA 226]MUL74670.1 NUDIX hydrolase [Mycolicibacterium sp. CBMA 226]